MITTFYKFYMLPEMLYSDSSATTAFLRSPPTYSQIGRQPMSAVAAQIVDSTHQAVATPVCAMTCPPTIGPMNVPTEYIRLKIEKT